jgi:hypothetical protein
MWSSTVDSVFLLDDLQGKLQGRNPGVDLIPERLCLLFYFRPTFFSSLHSLGPDYAIAPL